MSEERIMTLHPEGKAGVNVARDKYELVADAIRKVLKRRELTFMELMSAVGEQLEGRFEGSISGYVTTIKLDLEARGEVERVDGKSPQVLRLVNA